MIVCDRSRRHLPGGVRSSPRFWDCRLGACAAGRSADRDGFGGWICTPPAGATARFAVTGDKVTGQDETALAANAPEYGCQHEEPTNKTHRYPPDQLGGIRLGPYPSAWIESATLVQPAVTPTGGVVDEDRSDCDEDEPTEYFRQVQTANFLFADFGAATARPTEWSRSRTTNRAGAGTSRGG